MHPSNAPGIDCFLSIFFKKFCDVIGDENIWMVKIWWRDNMDLTSINKTCISLILKYLEPRSVASFWPISCCNVVYKSSLKQWLINLKAFRVTLHLLTKVLLFLRG